MEPQKLLRWNSKASILYAFGVWTMMGSVFYVTYRKQERPPDSANVQKTEEPGENQVIYTTAHSKTIITYKKDFVPFSVRLMDFIESFRGARGPGDEDGRK